jgi:thiamine-phosphate pyrophosphorylase
MGLEQALKEKVRSAFSAGVDYVQLREKDLSARRLASLVEELAGSPEKKNTRLLVNERWDVAASCGADGVHLPSDCVPLPVLRFLAGPPSPPPGPERPMPPESSGRRGPGGDRSNRRGTGKEMILGVSCHSEEDVAQAVRDGTSYILLGPIFETPSKPGAKPLGLGVLEEICLRFPVPIYALGGVTADNAAECIQAGAAGAAGIRLFQEAPNMEQLCRHLRSL